MLYSMMSRDRREDPGSGLLLYLRWVMLYRPVLHAVPIFEVPECPHDM
jgi:hypothetical protein